MANIKIIDLSTGSPESTSYIEATQVDSQAASGRSSVKVNMAELGNWIAGQGNSPLEYNDLKTEDDTPIGAINELHDSIGADVYDTNTSYTAGMYCIYNNTLYRCKENTSGAWDSTKWEAKTITSLLESKADKTSLPDLAIISANFTSALTANSSVVFDYEFTLPSGYKIISCFDNSYYANVQASVIRINSTTGHVFFNYIATVNVSSRTWEAKAVIAKNVN